MGDDIKENANALLELLRSFNDDIRSGMEAASGVEIPASSRITFGGMGGSGAFSDALVAAYTDEFHLPMRMVKDYHLPRGSIPGDLLVATSYSGTTEETLSLIDEARGRFWNCILVSSGRDMEAKAAEWGLPFVRMPEGRQPRFAFPFSFGVGKGILDALREQDDMEPLTDIHEIDIEAMEAIGRDIAGDIGNSIPIIVASGLLRHTTHRWKSQFAENAKQVAWSDELPEMDHNQIVGWMEGRRQCDLSVIMLRDYQISERMERRFDATMEMLESLEHPPKVISVEVGSDDTPVSAVLESVVLGDFTSVHLALKRGVDPIPVAPIERFKELLRS